MHDLAQLIGLGRNDHDLEQEAIHLRLGQRVGALELDGILRRQHDVGRIKAVSLAKHRDLALLHRFEHS